MTMLQQYFLMKAYLFFKQTFWCIMLNSCNRFCKKNKNFFQEKIDVLKVLGADVRPVPAVPFDNPENYNHQVINFFFYLQFTYKI